MKKILKSLMCMCVVVTCVFGFTACKPKVSDTTTEMTKSVFNGQQTNGGLTLVRDGYLYFINGMKDNDGTSATKNVKSAICRVKIDDESVIDDDSYEVVVDNLVGYDNGQIIAFGDYLYFATPCDDVNYQGSKLYNQTRIMRYDLVNKKSYTLYTTKLNDSSEEISYAFYTVGSELDLVVYEKSNETITSLKVGKKVAQNYVISDVASCIFSENYGVCVTEDASVDANNFVFYTKSTDVYDDGFSSGNKTFKVSPNKNDSVCISNEGKTVSLLSIRSGKLVYSGKSTDENEDIIYSQKITSSKTEKLNFVGVISYETYDNVIFVESGDEIYSVCMNDDTNEITILKVNGENELQIDSDIINTIEVDDDATMSFVTITTLTEKIDKEDEESETEENTYLVYVLSNAVYKLKIMVNGEISRFEEPVKLTKSTVETPSGNLIPEVIGNYLYILATEVDSDNASTGNKYLHRVDLTIEDDSSDYATIVAKK